jgi:hypothetical protein
MFSSVCAATVLPPSLQTSSRMTMRKLVLEESCPQRCLVDCFAICYVASTSERESRMCTYLTMSLCVAQPQTSILLWPKACNVRFCFLVPNLDSRTNILSYISKAMTETAHTHHSTQSQLQHCHVNNITTWQAMSSLLGLQSKYIIERPYLNSGH